MTLIPEDEIASDHNNECDSTQNIHILESASEDDDCNSLPATIAGNSTQGLETRNAVSDSNSENTLSAIPPAPNIQAATSSGRPARRVAQKRAHDMILTCKECGEDCSEGDSIVCDGPTCGQRVRFLMILKTSAQHTDNFIIILPFA